MSSVKINFRVPENIWNEFLRVMESDPLSTTPSALLRDLIIQYIKDNQKEENKMFKGIVKDQLGTMEDRTTKTYSTYFEAHQAAEKLCKKTMGDRGAISVIEVKDDK